MKAATSIMLTAVFPNPDQPRKHFDQAGLEELAASIKSNGLIQPITVRPDGSGRYMIVAGERRWRAHQIAGLKSIRAQIVEISDDALAIAAIVENLQRADITPLEEARAFRRMVDSGYSAEQLAERLGIKQPHRITDRLQLLRLDAGLLDLFEKKHLTPSQAFELSRLEGRGQKALFAMIREGKCPDYNKLRAAADGIIAAESQATMFGDAPAPTEEERNAMTRTERLIDRLTALCNAGIAENDVVLLKKINPDRAALLLEQLVLIRADIVRMEKALQQSIAQGALQLAATP